MQVLMYDLILAFFYIGSANGLNKVFFVDNNNNSIYHGNIQPGRLLTEVTYQKANLKGVKYPGVVTFDRKQKAVIWTQTVQKKIRLDFLGQTSRPDDLFSNAQVSCITFNEFNNNVYWFGNGSLRLNTMHVNGSEKVMLSQRNKRLYGLNVDGLRGILYFSELDRIVRMNVDGSGEEVLLDTGLTNVTSLTRNAQDNCLYWINAPGLIEKYNTITYERSILQDVSSLIGRVVQIAVYNDTFYWADGDREGIGYIGLNDPANHGFVTSITRRNDEIHSLDGISDLKVFIVEQVDSCSLRPCGEGMICINKKVTSYVCDHNSTATNSTQNGTPQTIEQPQETAQENCSRCEHGECTLYNDMFTCICDGGFQSKVVDEHITCVDSDECERKPCDPGDCVNTAGAYYCTCPEGFATADDGSTCNEANGHGDVKGGNGKVEELSSESSCDYSGQDGIRIRRAPLFVFVIAIIVEFVVFSQLSSSSLP